MTTWHAPATTRPPAPVLFLDRDGVIIEDRHYLADPDDVKLVPGAAPALVRARRAGYTLVGVSNQSGLGRGRFGPDDLARVMTRLDDLLAAAGAPLDAFHYCPHAPEDGCDCRKPRPGLLQQASRRTPWIAAASWTIGDKPSDVELGRAADLGAVLVRTGYGRASEQEVRARWRDDPRVLVAEDLGAAVAAILARDGGSR